MNSSSIACVEKKSFQDSKKYCGWLISIRDHPTQTNIVISKKISLNLLVERTSITCQLLNCYILVDAILNTKESKGKFFVYIAAAWTGSPLLSDYSACDLKKKLSTIVFPL